MGMMCVAPVLSDRSLTVVIMKSIREIVYGLDIGASGLTDV